MTTHAELFETYRPLLFSIAYRMLGSVMEAEDMVQESYLRSLTTPIEQIESPKAFLCTIVTRLCLDQLKSARLRRESYVGPWLPEPLLTEHTPEEVLNKHETLSLAFLVLLESLAPVERAIFLLREVFDYEYAEIAQIVEKSEANCRQLYHRAKQSVSERRPRFAPARPLQEKLLTSFLTAVSQGDLTGLTNLLAEEITLWSDGGGKVRAALHPIVGADKVARFLLGLMRFWSDSMRLEGVEVNGSLALLLWDGDQIHTVMNFVLDEAKIYEMRFVLNPDKLQHIGKNIGAAPLAR